jgi:SPP1 gp7 family putative phage head morphogenesis protein
MEKRLSAIYSRAEKEIQKTADEYFSKFAKQDEAKRKLLEQGKITEDEYKKWRKGKVMYGKRFTEMKEECAKQILNVNQTALAYVNGELPEVYSINYNALAGSVDGVGGYSFALVDADTVRNLAVTDTSLLPYKEIDPAKDIPWNMKKINAETLQGVLQGESMDKIAKRLRNVQEMNKTQAIRSARTIVTGAENKGRQDSYARAEADGIILQKEWLATNDGRTRHSHAALDGAIVDQDKKFDNGLMYPGDPSGRPEEVYNCRCTLVAKVNGFKKAQVQKAMEEKDEYTQAERDEFAALQKKYKNKTEVMLFGTEEETLRYDYLLQKDKANAGAFDYYKKFQHQSIAESRLNGWRVDPTAAERDAISSYSRSGYLKMNENLRFGNYAPDSVKREISALHGFLDKCETQEELYLSRGVTKPALDKMFGGDGWRKNSSSLVGSVFTDKGFVSTTPYQGGGFGGDVVMYIKAPKGTKGAYIKNFAASSEEKEFLIQSDTSFVVRNIVEEVDKWGDKKYKVFAEVIV